MVCKYQNHVADKRSLGERGGRMNHRGEFLAVGGRETGNWMSLTSRDESLFVVEGNEVRRSLCPAKSL
jgi:hypothetical protein